ncbi:MAG: PleD family two-component system response regulator [Spirochaetota bacterium]
MENIRQIILIVDDEPGNIEIISELLNADYEILFATTGKEALDIAHEQDPDLVLLDIQMPDIDGYEVCARLKSNSKTRDIPVIFITAKDHEEDEARGLEAGALDYITKPISPAILRARVHNHIELKRYHDILKNLSMTDGLTGIANRRRLDQHLEFEWRRGIRNKTPLSFILMDIDYFKLYNDHYGHLIGDDCLRQLAQALSEVVQRSGDLVARYGGEEFACVLSDTNNSGATLVGNQIIKKINSLNITFEYSEVADRVTVSVGIATMIPSDKHKPINLIQRADELLYKAKRDGRNQIRSSGEEEKKQN